MGGGQTNSLLSAVRMQCGVAVYCHHVVLYVITGWIRKRKCLFRYVGASEESDSLGS
jgi:hypothetical protein